MPIHPILIDIGLTLLSEAVSWIFSSKKHGDDNITATGAQKKALVISKIKRFFIEHDTIMLDNAGDFIDDFYRLIKDNGFLVVGPKLLLFIIEEIWKQESAGKIIEGPDKAEEVLKLCKEFMNDHGINVSDFEILTDDQDISSLDLEILVDDIVCLLNKHRIFQKRG